MGRFRISLLLWFALLLAGLALPLILRKAPDLPELGEAPRLLMTDSTGTEFDSNDLRGKVYLVNFFFSSCEGVCPALNGRIATLYKEYQGDPSVHFISITVDPETDTPAVLEQYAKRFGANPAQWHFLTAPEEKVRGIIESGFRLVNPDSKTLHTTRVVLVDRRGKVRSLHQGTQDQFIKEATVEIASLLQERP